MSLVCLNIGPSLISAEVKHDIAQIVAGDLLSQSHRSDVVCREFQSAVANLRTALRIPEDYSICFQPSATACMELVLRNCVAERSFHFVQGAFASRWAATADQIGLDAVRYERTWNESSAPREARIPEGIELIAVTHNETSTGLMWPWEEVRALRDLHPETLLAIDVTSSFGAMAMDWTLGDIWFGSIQKCLGLPSGLGYVLASPRALERARALGPRRHVAGWQDLPDLVGRLELGQTPETPNILSAALLARQMARWDIDAVEAGTLAKAKIVADALEDTDFFIREPAWRSLTAQCIQVDDTAAWTARAAAAGYAIGSGYGPLQGTCVRIATFPTVSEAQVSEVMAALTAR